MFIIVKICYSISVYKFDFKWMQLMKKKRGDTYGQKKQQNDMDHNDDHL